MATSNEQDFQLLKLVAFRLDALASLSPSIAKLQTLFKSFIERCEGLMMKTIQNTLPEMGKGAQLQDIPGLQTDLLAPLPAVPTRDDHPEDSSSMCQFAAQQLLVSQPMQGSNMCFPKESVSVMMEPSWGLFDTQPILDWLDTDVSSIESARET